jgi:hypothetical protein
MEQVKNEWGGWEISVWPGVIFSHRREWEKVPTFLEGVLGV